MKRVFLILLLLILIGGAGFFILYRNKSPQTVSIPNPLDNSKSTKSFPDETVLVKNLNIPWSIAFLPNGDALITQRPGTILLVDKNFEEAPKEIAKVNVKAQGEGGLLGIEVSPNFQTNNNVFVYYTYGDEGQNTLNRISRLTFNNGSLSDEKVIVNGIPGASNHNGGRIKFGPDGFLYIGTGDAQEPSLSQNTSSLAGKILRVDEEGRPAPDNPFNNPVYSYGHRNVQGLAWDSNGELWATEHGASTKDEINKIIKGQNYGWPTITGDQTRSGMVTAELNSGSGTWAPSGSVFQSGKLYFTGLRGTDLFKFDPSDKSVTKLVNGKYGRIRDIVLGPDEAFYVLTNNTDGRGVPGPDDDRLIRFSSSNFGM